MASRLAVDIGGTFTDLVFYDDARGQVRVEKGPTVPSAPAVGVCNVVRATISTDQLQESDLFLHGTTVGINTLVQRDGAVVGLLTTEGFRDVLETRRADRDEFYNMLWKAPAPLVPRRLRLTVRERIAADGSVYRELEEVDVRTAALAFVAAGVEAIAIIFLNAHANSANELAAERILREEGFAGAVSLSHRVTGEFREYERTSTTVIDAYVRPRVSRYLHDLSTSLKAEGFDGQLLVTRSGGGSMPFAEGAARPFETVMSGPVAGAAGAAELCRRLDIPIAVTADVGGTTFDTCLILDHEPQVKYEGAVDGMPLQTTWVDVRSIGAGGGSIAYVDAGLLSVGPRSAGATPGPVCYGRGGTEPTVTDAAAFLGMLALGNLAGGVSLDLDAAAATVADLGRNLGLGAERTAQGVIEVSTTAMANAIRVILEEVGEDPRGAALLAFGGAGPLFGGLVARELDVRRVVVPNHAGNFSAWGLLLQDLSRSAGRTIVVPLEASSMERVNQVLGSLERDLRDREQLEASPSASSQLSASLDLRYRGQEYAVTIPVSLGERSRVADDVHTITTLFQCAYESRYGHTSDTQIEIVTVRLTATTLLPRTKVLDAPLASTATRAARTVDTFSFRDGERRSFAVFDRLSLQPGYSGHGPMIVLEDTATTYVDGGFTATVAATGDLILDDEAAPRSVR